MIDLQTLRRRLSPGLPVLGLLAACNSNSSGDAAPISAGGVNKPVVVGTSGTFFNANDFNFGPFRAIRNAGNDGNQFANAISAADLGAGNTALLAVRQGAAGFGVFTSNFVGKVELLNDGAQFLLPSDLDIRGDQVLVSDLAAVNAGAIFAISVRTGDVEDVLALGFRPASVTVDGNNNTFFSGRDPVTGLAGVFKLLENGDVENVFVGAPLVDPSGIAVRADGSLLVADTSFNGGATAAVFSLVDGVANVVAQGFISGFPAGIALDRAETTLFMSGIGGDSLNRIFFLDLEAGIADAVEAQFTNFQNSAGGLHRGAASNTVVFACGSCNNGTIFRLD